MSDAESEFVTTGQAEVGSNPSRGEVYLDYAGERSYMQPGEARQFAELLLMAADAAGDGDGCE